jgi:formylglycine-generating enzyme required for sulfatase activity
MHTGLGDYVILDSIGQGTLGEVLRAQHRFLKRNFALKVLPFELTQEEGFIERFETELSSIATLDHPHIVKIHNISFAEGRYFLVVDCIADADETPVNLAQYLQKKGGHLSEEEVFQIAHQIASALDYAHARKQPLIHHGIKLSNVLVTIQNGLKVYLSDFGLSQVIGQARVLSTAYKIAAESVGADLAGLSQFHQSFLQSFAFLSPEQKRGTISATDGHKSDIYAFGVLIYYLLTGQFPEAFFELPSECLRDEQTKYNWDPLIRSCLHYNPSRRPDTLKQLLEELSVPVQEGPKPMIHAPELKKPQFETDPASLFHVETGVMRYQPKAETPKQIDPILTEMAIIPAGAFWRGSNNGGRDEMPRHQVHLKSFAIDIHPVTNEQFVRFLEAMGGEKDHQNNDLIRLRDSRIKRFGGKVTIETGYAKHPVVGISWYGAVAYAKWMGKRLPTEAEWEVASLGGQEDFCYPTGKNIEKPQANFFSSDTTIVMSYPPNGYGLYDMAANVYEWCQDWYDFHYYDEAAQDPHNPLGPSQGVYRVLRGGCWKSLKQDLRCAHRHRNNPGTMNATYGFRCAADVS